MVILRLSRRSISVLASIGYLASESVGNPGALFFGCDVGFDQLNGANKISQYLTNYCDLSYCTFARCLETRLYVHLRAPNGLVRHI